MIAGLSQGMLYPSQGMLKPPQGMLRLRKGCQEFASIDENLRIKSPRRRLKNLGHCPNRGGGDPTT